MTATAIREPGPATLRGVKKYVLATRPPFLTAALVPALMGIAAASFSGIDLNYAWAFLTVLGALLAHAGINVLNDYYDSLSGTDDLNQERIYPFTGGSRFIQNGLLTPRQTAIYGAALLGAAAVIGVVLMTVATPRLLWVGLLGLLIGWAYSAPPLKLNSRGMGELCVGLGFGVLIPVGADVVQRATFDWLPVLIGVPYGLLITNLLYINQFPDRRADEACGKHHWVVRLGAQRAPWGYVLIAAVSYGWLTTVALMLEPWLLVGLCALPLSGIAALQLFKFARTPQQLAPAIRLTILAGMVLGVLMSLVLFVGASPARE
ncbi:MAG: prenyltransferase [Pseudomonadota bacterium]